MSDMSSRPGPDTRRRDHGRGRGSSQPSALRSPPSTQALLEHFSATLMCVDEAGRVAWLSAPVAGLKLGEPFAEAEDAGGKDALVWSQVSEAAGERWLVLKETQTHPESKPRAQHGTDSEYQAQKQELLGLLASSVAHELSNPIQGILNYSELISELGEAGGSIVDFAGQISAQTERLSRTIRSLLELTRPDPGQVRSEPIVGILESVELLVHSALMRDQVTLVKELAAEPGAMSCNGQLVRLSLLNLIYLAHQSAKRVFPGAAAERRVRIVTARSDDAGRPVLTLTIRASGKAGGLEAPLSALDSMEAERRRRFFHVSSSVARAHGGSLVQDAAAPAFAARLTLPLDEESSA